MHYTFNSLTIRELVNYIDKNQIDLNPPYQRNFIWSTKDQQELINTILLGFPLPNFFIYTRPDGMLEMVDGQQRSKTIYRFVKGQIKASKGFGSLVFEQFDNKEQILDYALPFVIISDLAPNESLNDFYVLINKKGRQLNPAEIHKSEFHDTNFLKLANDSLTYQNFINLNLFNDSATKRMNDREFVEELLVYLHLGITDKKKSIEETFESDIDDHQYESLKMNFEEVIDKVEFLNKFHAISDTRYKQKSDFFTLFSFVHLNNNLSTDILLHQYKILLVLDREDEDGRQFIRPTNEDCRPLKDYATNCVSQSNSRKARESRLAFFNSILLNSDVTQNDVLVEVLNFLADKYGEKKIALVRIENFELLDVNLLNY